jgi:glycosyltransferase involved in cell wall biosynthesis
METPWLSVIVTAHNRDRWLAEALQSIADQRDDGIEVVAVDASENEACWRVINSFARKLRLAAHRRIDLQSQTQKINFGVDRAKAVRICILHDDDLWLPNRAVEVRRWISAWPNAVMHLHPSYIIDEAGRRMGLWRCPLPPAPSRVPIDRFLKCLLIQNFIAIPSPVIRRDAFLAVGGMDGALWYAPDWDLYLKLSPLGEIYYHPQPLTGYRVHDKSLTILASKDTSDFRMQHHMVVSRHITKLNNLEERRRVMRTARASINVNAGLAAAMRGNLTELPRAIGSLLMLGPAGIMKYFNSSRIIDRVMPRLRALFGRVLQG